MAEKVTYHGWRNAWRLSDGTIEVIVLPDVGSRIIRYVFCGPPLAATANIG